MRLKEIRKEQGLSVAALSKLSGVPLRTIQDIEARGDCRISTASQLCDALDCSLDDLVYPVGGSPEIDSHSYRVIQLCLEFACALDLTEKHLEILLSAARLHDICKSEPKHQKAAAERIIQERLAPHRYRVADVVRCHRKSFDPDPRNWEMAAALRLSDKLDKFSRGKEDAEEKCRDSMGKIIDWCGGMHSERLRCIYDTYSRILDRMQQ